MRYASPGAFRTALERRLLTLAEQTNVPMVRLRKLVVFDRLMARLIVVAPDRWILKGAVAMHFRVGPQFRTTRDLDLGRRDNEQAATTDLRLVQSVELGDYFSFAIQRTSKLDSLLEGSAVRYHITAEVDRRPFEQVIVDVGFTDPPGFEPDVLRGPDLLSFADIPPVEVPTLPLEQHVAEKVHAYTRAYAGGQPSSRIKDLVDLVVISSLFGFQAGKLRRAIEITFAARGTHALPAVLPLPLPQWAVAYRRMAAEVGLEPDELVGHERAGAFLTPVFASTLADDAHWSPTENTWL